MWYGDSVGKEVDKNSSGFFPNQNALVTISKGIMRSVSKLCSYRIL